MAKIKPFKAVRPSSDKVHLVASRSYISYTREKLIEKLDTNPFTFIHVINPDYNEEKRAKGGTPEIFKKVRSKYDSFLAEGIFVKDKEESIYVYNQITPTHSYTGIIAGVSVEEYRNQTIKIHESTIPRREKLFTEYLDSTNFNAEPVLLSYAKNEKTSELINLVTTSTPIYDFTTSDKIRHKLWKVSEPGFIEKIQQSLDSTSHLYIADGHHRSASSVLLSEKRNNPEPNANSNWFMAMITQEDEMEIFGFHRLLRGFSKSESDRIISEINSNFKLSEIKENCYSPEPGDVHMYYFGTGWTKFSLHNNAIEQATDYIDAEKFSQQVLAPIAGITDLKNDSRVKFIPGKEDLKKLENSLNDGNEILFLLAPVTFDQLKNVAQANEFMPPKSTYIEPKLRSGLTIFEISDE